MFGMASGLIEAVAELHSPYTRATRVKPWKRRNPGPLLSKKAAVGDPERGTTYSKTTSVVVDPHEITRVTGTEKEEKAAMLDTL